MSCMVPDSNDRLLGSLTSLSYEEIASLLCNNEGGCRLDCRLNRCVIHCSPFEL